MEVVRIGQILGIFWVKQIELADEFDNAVWKKEGVKGDSKIFDIY